MSPSMNSWRAWRARWARPQTLVLEGVAEFADWCAAHPYSACALVVPARALHEMSFEAGLPLPDDAARLSYARQQFTHYFGAQAQRWAYAAWSGGASALHGVDLAALREVAQKYGVHLQRIEPFWAPLLRRLAVEEPDWLRAPRAALAWVEGGLLSWLTLDEGRVQALRQSRLAAATQQALGEALAELRDGRQVLVAGQGLDAGASPVWPGVRVLGSLGAAQVDAALFEATQEPRTPLPRPDFLDRSKLRSALAWPLAAVGVVLLALAGWQLAAAHQQREQAAQTLAALQARRPLAVVVAAPAPAPARSSTADADARAREVQALLLEAWEPLLANVEQAGVAAQLSWLSLDLNAARNELRLEGLTPDKLVALQLVDRLNLTPGWSQVMLGRFQNGEQGLPGQRFELSARLDPARMQDQLAKAVSGARR